MDSKTPLELVVEGFEQSGMCYGDIINHSDINNWSAVEFPDMSGMSPGEQKRMADKYNLERLTVVDGLRDYLLRERLMYLESIPGTGYRIVEPAQQTDAAVRKGMAQIQKGLKHATAGVERVNTALLDDREREYNTSVKARLSGLARMIGQKRDYISIE